MYKTGVTSRGTFAERTLQLEQEHRIWRPFSYTILEELQQTYTLTDEPLLERLYQSLSAGDKIRKITRRGRFRELDAWLVEECNRRFAGVDSLVVHDVGASNGITSLELFELLSRERKVEVHATDYFDRLYLVTLHDENWTIAFDVDRQPLQAVRGRWVLSLRRPHPWRHPVNRWLQQRVLRDVVPQAKLILDQCLDHTDDSCLEDSRYFFREVSLIHPQCIDLASRESAFHIGQHDLFQASCVRSHVVRALNVLTSKHFSEELVVSGIKQLACNLAPSGLLILGRSIDEEDGRLRATAFEVDGCRLRPAWHLHHGFEDIELAESVRLDCRSVAALGDESN